MRKVLVFNMDVDGDQDEFNIHNAAPALFNVVTDMRQELRNKLKYEELTTGERDFYEALNTRFWEICSENEITHLL